MKAIMQKNDSSKPTGQLNYSTLVILNTCKQELWQTVKSQMNYRIMRHFIGISTVCKDKKKNSQQKCKGAQWLSSRVLDLRPRDCRFEPHRCHCVVSLSKTHLSLLSIGSTQEDPPPHNWKIVDWDVKNQIKQKRHRNLEISTFGPLKYKIILNDVKWTIPYLFYQHAYGKIHPNEKG